MINKLEIGGTMEDIRNLIENLLDDIKDVEKKKIKRKVNTNHVKASINLDLEGKSDGYYVSKLRLMGNIIDLPSQLKSQTLSLYISFARFIDKNYNLPNSTYLYNQLYNLARDYVEDFVDPNHEKNLARIYELMYSLTKKDLSCDLDKLARDFLKSFPDFNEETISFYNLAQNGKKAVFWDPDGRLREKYKFKKDEERALLDLSQRRNVLRDNELLANFTINLFLKGLKEIFSREDINSDVLKTYQSPYTLSKNLLDSLLIITEDRVRSIFSFLADIKTEDAYDFLVKNSCDNILFELENYQTKLLANIDSKLTYEIYLDYFDKNPKKTRDMAIFIEGLDIKDQAKILEAYKHRGNFREILDKLLKSDFTPTKILALSYIYKYKIEKPKDKKILFDIIREDNYEDFLDLINKGDFDIDLVSEVLDLRKVKSKRIKLDKKLVKKSRKDLSDTVETISDFVGEDIDNDRQIEEKTKEENIETKPSKGKISQPARYFLEKILRQGSISKERASEIAIGEGLFLNVFINNINDELFEYINDQTLVIEDSKVFIDEFYVEMVKELIDG